VQRSPDEKRANGDKADRVVGGEVIVDGTWPWLAAVGRKASGPRCGGSLIADRWILTAAHCFTDVSVQLFVIQYCPHWRIFLSMSLDLNLHCRNKQFIQYL